MIPITADTGLSPETLVRLQHLFAAMPEVAQVVLYGSRTKGTHRPGSDIDLTISGSGLNLRHLNRLARQLDDLLLPYQIDLSILERIDNPALLAHIERVGVVIYDFRLTIDDCYDT